MCRIAKRGQELQLKTTTKNPRRLNQKPKTVSKEPKSNSKRPKTRLSLIIGSREAPMMVPRSHQQAAKNSVHLISECAELPRPGKNS